jgi:hypothetical protein
MINNTFGLMSFNIYCLFHLSDFLSFLWVIYRWTNRELKTLVNVEHQQERPSEENYCSTIFSPHRFQFSFCGNNQHASRLQYVFFMTLTRSILGLTYHISKDNPITMSMNSSNQTSNTMDLKLRLSLKLNSFYLQHMK